MTMTAHRRACPKCGNGMIVQHERSPRDFEAAVDAQVWKCLACGKEEPVEMPTQPTNTTNGPPAGYRIHPTWKTPDSQSTAVAVRDPLSEAPSWTDGAIQRLTGLIAAVAQADALKAEAERTHAALAAYGVTNLPALPWKRAGPAGTTTRAGKLGPLPTTCARCGVAFTGRAQWRYLRNAEAGVCRDKPACANRARATSGEPT